MTDDDIVEINAAAAEIDGEPTYEVIHTVSPGDGTPAVVTRTEEVIEVSSDDDAVAIEVHFGIPEQVMVGGNVRYTHQDLKIRLDAKGARTVAYQLLLFANDLDD